MRLRLQIAIGRKDVGKPHGHAVHNNDAAGRGFAVEGRGEVQRLLDRGPPGATLAAMPSNPLGHFGVFRLGRDDHHQFKRQRLGKQAGIAALAGFCAPDDERASKDRGFGHHACLGERSFYHINVRGIEQSGLEQAFPCGKEDMNSIFAALPTTIFEVMSGLARDRGAINLGQGFPDDPGPEDVRRKAAEAAIEGPNQYPSMMGIPALRTAISDHYRRFQGLDLNPEQETLVTSGATEALAAAILALIEPGDEVVLFQPMYDAYLPLVLRAGGVPRFVTLRPPHWSIIEDDLKAAFNEKTRVVVFNNPLNPCGTVYPREQLELLARFCQRWNVIAVCDEVWEHIVFDGRSHVSMMSIPGMRDRTVKIGSAGKIFSLTGWKVGLVAAAPALLKVLAKAHQFLTFTTPPNLQTAVAFGLGKPADYFDAMRLAFQRSRDRFTSGLSDLGYCVLPSQGTYFLNLDIAPLGEEGDARFCMRLVEEAGVAAIPVSAFYARDHVRSVVRLCFAKQDSTLDAALSRLRHAAHPN